MPQVNGKYKPNMKAPRTPYVEELPEDAQTREKKAVQKLTDGYIAQIEDLLKTKTAEIMEI